jgi:hypothetical protein
MPVWPAPTVSLRRLWSLCRRAAGPRSAPPVWSMPPCWIRSSYAICAARSARSAAASVVTTSAAISSIPWFPAGMKMLNALARHGFRRTRAVADTVRREGLSLSCCGCCRPSSRTSPTPCGGNSAMALRCLSAAWPEAGGSGARRGRWSSLVVQVNGKLRGQIEVPVDAERTAIEQAAQDEPNVQKFRRRASRVRKIVIVARQAGQPGVLRRTVMSRFMAAALTVPVLLIAGCAASSCAARRTCRRSWRCVLCPEPARVSGCATGCILSRKRLQSRAGRAAG